MITNKIKPKLRGYLHQEAFFIFLGACTLLIFKSVTTLQLAASFVYTFGLLFLFGISTIYHRPHWQPKARALMKRLDHSAIFVLIAGTFTPICLLALPENLGRRLLLIIWIFAVFGILQSIFWIKAPKILTSFIYIFMGWLALPYIPDLKISLGNLNLFFVICGGVVYTIGALFYAFKKPNLYPKIFGYHELFHLFTIFGAGLHFAAIYRLVG